MMFNKKRKPDLSKLNSIVAKGMKISGEVEFSGTMKISGEVKGSVVDCDHDKDSKVNAESVAIIEGNVNGESIIADHIIVTGVVHVNKIIAKKSLVVISGGFIKCANISYKSLTTDDSAFIEGNLSSVAPPSGGLTVEA